MRVATAEVIAVNFTLLMMLEEAATLKCTRLINHLFGVLHSRT